MTGGDTEASSIILQDGALWLRQSHTQATQTLPLRADNGTPVMPSLVSGRFEIRLTTWQQWKANSEAWRDILWSNLYLWAFLDGILFDSLQSWSSQWISIRQEAESLDTLNGAWTIREDWHKCFTNFLMSWVLTFQKTPKTSWQWEHEMEQWKGLRRVLKTEISWSNQTEPCQEALGSSLYSSILPVGDKFLGYKHQVPIK